MSDELSQAANLKPNLNSNLIPNSTPIFKPKFRFNLRPSPKTNLTYICSVEAQALSMQKLFF